MEYRRRARHRRRGSAYEPVASEISPYKLLSMLHDGEKGKIMSLEGGRGLERKLIELGFLPGVEVRVLCNMSQGPLVVLLKDSKMGIGRGVAGKILIEVE